MRMNDFETLLASCRTAVERWVRSRVNSSADAEDILQETYLAAFRGFPELRNLSVFLPWILGIARRKYADWCRAQARRKEILLGSLPDMPADTQEPTREDNT